MGYKRKARDTTKISEQFSMETLFERFPHLTEQIFGQLKGKSLPICKEVSRIWSSKIEDYRHYFNRKILRYSKDSDVYENEWKLAVEKMPIRYLSSFERYVYDYMRRFDGKFSPFHVFAFYQNIDRQLPIGSFKMMLEKIPMTYGAKLKLTIELEKLSGAELAGVVNIAIQNEPNLRYKEIDVDMEKLKLSTLRAMENLIVMKNSKEKFENIQRTSYTRKRLLAFEINKLSGTELQQLVNIVAQNEPNPLTTNPDDEIELDFEKIKRSTFRLIENFTTMTLKKMRKMTNIS
jgi:hypothetical protein